MLRTAGSSAKGRRGGPPHQYFALSGGWYSHSARPLGLKTRHPTDQSPRSDPPPRSRQSAPEPHSHASTKSGPPHPHPRESRPAALESPVPDRHTHTSPASRPTTPRPRSHSAYDASSRPAPV